MNILTVNLLLSTFVFWVAARIYILPKLPELRPQSVLVPILLLHSFRHLGLMFLAPGASYAGIPAQFAYPAALGDLLAALLAATAIVPVAKNSRSARLSRMDLQRGRNGGPGRSHSAGDNAWSSGLYGPGVLDTRVLGSCITGDALHHLHCSRQVPNRCDPDGRCPVSGPLVPDRRSLLHAPRKFCPALSAIPTTKTPSAILSCTAPSSAATFEKSSGYSLLAPIPGSRTATAAPRCMLRRSSGTRISMSYSRARATSISIGCWTRRSRRLFPPAIP